jgi:hypothetical protein
MRGLRVWPVRVIPRPNDEVVWAGTPGEPERAAMRKRQGAGGAGEESLFSTHVQTQIDRLRARGVTGKGIRIAVIDTGVSHPQVHTLEDVADTAED